MKINIIKIKNFRGIGREFQEIKFGDLSTLVGRNDCGKSCILIALNYFFKNLKMTSDDFYKGAQQGDEIVMEIDFFNNNMFEVLKEYLTANNKKDIGVEEEVSFLMISPDTIKIKKIWQEVKKAPVIEVGVLDYKNPLYSGLSEKKSEELIKLIDNLKIVIPPDSPGRNSDLEKIKYIREYLENENEEKIISWKKDKEIDKLLPNFELFQADYAIETGTEFNNNFRTETYQTFTNDDGGHIEQIENNIQEKMDDEAEQIKSFMQHHVDDLDQIEIEPNYDWTKAINNVSVRLKFTSDKFLIPLQNKGSGYRRLFMVGRFRYLASKNSANSIFAIEEPETFLHPSAQDDLLNSLLELSEDNQIIITTHSPIFAGYTKNENIILCKKDEGQLTYSQPKTQTDSMIDEVISELGIKPYHNLRDKFENIIFTESHNDIEFYNIAAQKLKSITISNDNNLFLPGYGNSLKFLIEREYFKKCKRNLFLWIDSDVYEVNEDNVKSKKSKYEDNCLLCGHFKREYGKPYMLKGRCIENYYHPRAIERLLDIEDKKIPYDIFPNTLIVPEFLNKFKEENSITNNIKIKNNFNIFNEMTKEEWIEVSQGELEELIEDIK